MHVVEKQEIGMWEKEKFVYKNNQDSFIGEENTNPENTNSCLYYLYLLQN